MICWKLSKNSSFPHDHYLRRYVYLLWGPTGFCLCICPFRHPCVSSKGKANACLIPTPKKLVLQTGKPWVPPTGYLGSYALVSQVLLCLDLHRELAGLPLQNTACLSRRHLNLRGQRAWWRFIGKNPERVEDRRIPGVMQEE